MKTSISKSGFAVIAAAVVLLGSQWAMAGNLPGWGGGVTTQPQPIQQPRQPLISQPAANVAPSVQVPQPGTWTVPGTTSTPTVVTPTQQPRSFQPGARSKVTPRTGFTTRAFNLQPKAVGRHLEQRASGFGPQLPAIAPPTVCSGYRQTPDTDRLNAPPPSQNYSPRSATGADLHCTDLRGAFLEGADLKGANLRGANLSGVNLRRADFTGAFLEDADLTGADLWSDTFTNAKLNRTNLSDTHIVRAIGADFRGAIIDNTVFSGTLKNSHFDGLDFRKLKQRYQGISGDFTGATFANTIFSGVALSGGAVFSNAYMARVSFSNAHILASKFAGTDLSGADFSNTILYQVDFSNARLTGAKFIGMDTASENGENPRFAGTLRKRSEGALINSYLKFNGAMAMDADFTNAFLYSQVFTDTNLARARFNGAMLQQSNFHKTDLTGASFVGSDLTKSKFDGVNAERAKLDSAKLELVRIEGANFKQASITNVDMSYSMISNSSFYQANLERSVLKRVTFDSLDLRMANFQATDLFGGQFIAPTQFYGANFTGAHMTRVRACLFHLFPAMTPTTDLGRLECVDSNSGPLNLQNVNFSNANLSYAFLPGSNLSNSNLRGADLTSATLTDVNWSGAIMPDGTAHP